MRFCRVRLGSLICRLIGQTLPLVLVPAAPQVTGDETDLTKIVFFSAKLGSIIFKCAWRGGLATMEEELNLEEKGGRGA